MISTRSAGLLIDTVVCISLAKWETVSGRFGGYLSTGFPNHFFCDSWVVGFWRADRGWQDVGLERRAWTLSQAVSGSVGTQGAATDVPALRVGADRSWRSQEHSA